MGKGMDWRKARRFVDIEAAEERRYRAMTHQADKLLSEPATTPRKPLDWRLANCLHSPVTTQPGQLAAAAASARKAILADRALCAETAASSRSTADWHADEAGRFLPGSATHTHHEALAVAFLLDAEECDRGAAKKA